MNNLPHTNLSPTYKHLLEEVGIQLNNRKSLLLKRVLLITWPVLLWVVYITLGYLYVHDVSVNHFLSSLSYTPLWLKGGIFFGGFWLIFSIFYVVVVKEIFEVEKTIWINSYLDKKDLDQKSSWRIAKKLLWQTLKLNLVIFLRYYLLPLALLFITIFSIYLILRSNSSNSYQISFYVLFGIFGIYVYYLNIKLRYIRFIFLDYYGKTTSLLKDIFIEMEKLNKVEESETFKKALLINIGIDSLEVIAKSATEIFASAINHVGRTNNLFGNLFRVYGNEMSEQAASLGKIAATYILYRFVRLQAYNKEQEVNEEIYKLAE